MLHYFKNARLILFNFLFYSLFCFLFFIFNHSISFASDFNQHLNIENQKDNQNDSEKTLTLSKAIEKAFDNHPEINQARLEIEAQKAAQLKAQVRPNPELGLIVEDTGNNSRSTTLQWSQTWERSDKRSNRMLAAQSAQDQAQVSLQMKQIELQADVQNAFFQVLSAQEKIHLSQSALELAEKAAHITNRRLAAGKIAPLEHTKAQLAQSSAELELLQAQNDWQIARKRLSAFWGKSASFEHWLFAEGEVQPAVSHETQAQLEELATLNQAIEQAPLMRLAKLELSKRQAISAEENAKKTPDWTFSLGAKRDSAQGQTLAIVGLTVPIPLLDNNQGAWMQAQKQEDQAQEAISNVQRQLESELSQLLQQLKLHHKQIQRLEAVLLPSAQNASFVAVKGYEEGKFTFLDVLDAQRTLFQLREQALNAKTQAAESSTQIQRLLGLPYEKSP